MFYCIDTINQYQNIDFSLCLTESDIKSSEKITESTEYYSFVNEEICKYFNIKRTTNPNQNPYKTIKNSFYPQKIFNLENLSNQNPKNIRFCPNDQSINFPIVCKDSDIFIRLE